MERGLTTHEFRIGKRMRSGQRSSNSFENFYFIFVWYSSCARKDLNHLHSFSVVQTIVATSLILFGDSDSCWNFLQLIRVQFHLNDLIWKLQKKALIYLYEKHRIIFQPHFKCVPHSVVHDNIPTCWWLIHSYWIVKSLFLILKTQSAMVKTSENSSNIS